MRRLLSIIGRARRGLDGNRWRGVVGPSQPETTAVMSLARALEPECAILTDWGRRAASIWESYLDIHLDPLGGLSGDMFVAALLDAFPEHWPHVQSTIASLNLGAAAECRFAPHHDDFFAGSRFCRRR